MAGTKITQHSAFATPTRRYGSFSTNVVIALTAIDSAEVFGTLQLSQPRTIGLITQLQPGAASGRRYGNFSGKVGVVLSSIASAEALGNLIVIGGTLTISPSGITSEETIGAHTLTAAGTIAPAGIDSTEAFGTHLVAPAGTISFFGVGAGQKLLSWTAGTEPDLAGYRVKVGLVSGVYNTEYDVGLTGTPATPSYVIANLTEGVTYFAAVTAYDTSNNESGFSAEVSFAGPAGARFGTSTLEVEKILQPPSIASAEIFGSGVIARGGIDLLPAGITSGEAVGSNIIVDLTGSLFLDPVGLASEAAFGTATVVPGEVTITASGITSSELFGTPELFAVLSLLLPSLASAEAVGTPLIEIFGLGTDQIVVTIAIPSAEVVSGVPFSGEEDPEVLQLAYTVEVPQISSAEAFGSTAVVHLIEPVGIVTQEAHGTHTVIAEAITLLLTSIASAETTGSVLVITQESQLSVDVFQSLDRTFTFPSTAIKPTPATVN